jgi:transposase-like protein
MWRHAWEHVIPFFAFPPAIRRVIYTTNALESVHARVRTIIKTRGHFPTDEAATKRMWLVLRHITAAWSKAAHHWRMAYTAAAAAAGTDRPAATAAKIKTASHTKFLIAPIFFQRSFSVI